MCSRGMLITCSQMKASDVVETDGHIAESVPADKCKVSSLILPRIDTNEVEDGDGTRPNYAPPPPEHPTL